MLVFCPTKASCSQTCRLVKENLWRYSQQSLSIPVKRKSDEISATSGEIPSVISHGCQLSPRQLVEARREAAGSLLALENRVQGKSAEKESLLNSVALEESPLASAVLLGLGFHHAGLSSDEREIIESCYRKGVISVLAGNTFPITF